jgi:hypothetical protein
MESFNNSLTLKEIQDNIIDSRQGWFGFACSGRGHSGLNWNGFTNRFGVFGKAIDKIFLFQVAQWQLKKFRHEVIAQEPQKEFKKQLNSDLKRQKNWFL